LAGKKVLLIDADPQANLSQSLGMKDEPEINGGGGFSRSSFLYGN
jgi:cellulose biosynthesis protein BcsQ